MGNMSNLINTKYKCTAELVKNWNGIIDILKLKHINRTVEISPSIAEKYRFDLYGLFKKELAVPEEQIYPHIRINGYYSSDQYDGGKLKLHLLDSTVLYNYYKLFTKK